MVGMCVYSVPLAMSSNANNHDINIALSSSLHTVAGVDEFVGCIICFSFS